MTYVYQVHPNKKRSFFDSLSLNTILIILNVATFLIFTLLIKLGYLSIDFVAIKPSNIVEGKYLWTFLTSMFMHAGFFHLLVNIFSLFFVGSLIEKIIGRKRYFWFYLFSGIFAGAFFVLLSLFFPGDFGVYAVGASGALFGLIGLLMLLTPNLPVYVMFIPIPIKMKYAAPGMLVLLWVISIAGNISIGNTAHLGGLVAGLIYGVFLRSKYKNKTKYIRKHFS
ncbi:MAG: rhomboid family intramembrane serine protease [Patescibacteria group bacterium]|jgi:membrane associated rhomboid family serine protease